MFTVGLSSQKKTIVFDLQLQNIMQVNYVQLF